MVRLGLILALAVLPAINLHAAETDDLKITTDKVIGATHFLESHPLDPAAPGLRALMADWEDKATEVVDYVCPKVLDPVPSDAAAHSPELLVQFIFGSAAYQLANPANKGALVPSQLAGIRSMLKAYQGFVASDPKSRIARLDDLLQMEAAGSLDAYLTPIILESCKGPFEHG